MVENLYIPNSIRVHSGIYVDFMNLKPEMFTIEDIAHSLANQCRFAGHLPYFYSVAYHSVNVMSECDEENKLAGLLHDASEAYLIDMPRPIKHLITGYYDWEDKIMKIIAAKFGFQWPLPAQVVEKDNLLLEVEWEEIVMRQNTQFRLNNIEDAKTMFLNSFEKLSK